VLRAALATTLATLALAAPAAADWSGDGAADVLAVASDGRLLLYRGTGTGAFQPGAGQGIGTGWAQFPALMTGDWSGDGAPDILAVASDGRLLMYRGNGGGGFATGAGEQIGTGWSQFTALLLPRDWDGDARPDILARASDGRLLMYRGNGAGGFATGRAEQIGTGWQGFTALLAPGDWSGDGRQDLIARTGDGALILYRGDGQGGFPGRVQIGSGWQQFTALLAGGDFSGDGNPDILARASDGRLLMYRGDGDGGFVTGSAEQIGTGWNGLGGLMLSWNPPAPPSPPPPTPAPAAPLRDGSVRLNAGIRCTPPGGRLKVNLKVRRRAGRTAPRVRRVVFFIRGGARKVDRRRPYVVRLRVHRPAGSRGRVYARVVFTRPGSQKLRRKTVSRRFVMCS
jgi:VCBS repeat protein